MKSKLSIVVLLAFLAVARSPASPLDNMMRDIQRISESSRVVNFMDAYSLFVVVSGKLNPEGEYFPKTMDLLRANVALKVGPNPVPLLDESEMGSEAKELLDKLRPLITGMLGKFGKNIGLFVYKNAKGTSARIDAKEKGNITYTVFGEKFEWHLPLGCFLPDKYDEKTGDVFPGDYEFNPYTGDHLKVKRANQVLLPTPTAVTGAVGKL